MKSFNFLIAVAAIVTVSVVPIAGRIWYEIPLTETAEVAKVAIGAIVLCYILFKFKEG